MPALGVLLVCAAGSWAVWQQALGNINVLSIFNSGNETIQGNLTVGGTATFSGGIGGLTFSQMVSSFDVVSISTLQITGLISSTTYRLDYVITSTANFQPRLFFEFNPQSSQFNCTYLTNTSSVGSGLALTSESTNLGCGCNLGVEANLAFARQSTQGRLFFRIPNYGQGSSPGPMSGFYGDSITSNVAGSGANAVRSIHSCNTTNYATPYIGNIDIIISQVGAITTRGGNNNMLTGHFELWKVSSTSP